MKNGKFKQLDFKMVLKQCQNLSFSWFNLLRFYCIASSYCSWIVLLIVVVRTTSTTDTRSIAFTFTTIFSNQHHSRNGRISVRRRRRNGGRSGCYVHPNNDDIDIIGSQRLWATLNQSKRTNNTKSESITTISSTSANKSNCRYVNIKSVPWAGFRGLVPLQHFKNAMAYEDYSGWLRKPFPLSLSSSIVHDSCNSIKYNGEIDERVNNNDDDNDDDNAPTSKLQRKIKAESKASQPLNPHRDLKILYIDAHIIVVDKPSGVLSVPGPKRKPNTASLAYEYFGVSHNDNDDSSNSGSGSNSDLDIDNMIVHRLDMDTSGVLVYARDKDALGVLHDAFRNKSNQGQTKISSSSSSSSALKRTKQKKQKRQNDSSTSTTTTTTNFVSKKYEALVCGHVSCAEGEIDLPLVRDRENPPFMKVYTGEDMSFSALFQEGMLAEKNENKKDDNNTLLHKHKGYVKMMSKAPKESLTTFQVLSWEYMDGLPVTRLELVPITGRTHQLRVHCASIGHPIIGDNIYAFNGEGSPYGGLDLHIGDEFTALQQDLYNLVQDRRRQYEETSQILDSDSSHTNSKQISRIGGMLCLHAKQLNIFHPKTGSPMIFEADAPF